MQCSKERGQERFNPGGSAGRTRELQQRREGVALSSEMLLSGLILFPLQYLFYFTRRSRNPRKSLYALQADRGESAPRTTMI